MSYLLRKYKNIIYLTLLLVLVAGAWYIFINRNISAVPEKADLVRTFFNIMRDV